MNKENQFEGWEDPDNTLDFFSESSTKVEEIKNDKEPEENSEEDSITSLTKEVTGSIKNSKDIASNEDVFEDFTSEDVSEEDEDDNEVDDEVKSEHSPIISALQSLKDKGFIDYELEDGEDLTEELAEELIENSLDTRVESKIEELFEQLPEEVKQINKYVLKGGNLNEALKSYMKTAASPITDNLDLSKEENQELIVRAMLKEEGEDDEVIESEIEFFKDSDRLKKVAEKKFEKWKVKNKTERETLVKKQEAIDAERKQKERDYKNYLAKTLEETDAIGDLEISRKDKKDLTSYMAEKRFKLDNGSTITQSQKDLYEVLKDPKASIQLAKLLKTRNEDGTFNFESIKKNLETKVTSRVKQEIRRNKTSSPNKSSYGYNKSEKSLADLLN